MNSKEALKVLYNYNTDKGYDARYFRIVEKDLDRLEVLECKYEELLNEYTESNKLLTKYSKLEKVIEGFKKYPKMINESVRYDSAFGVQQMLGVSKEKAEEIKKYYYLLKEVLEDAR